MKGMKNMIYLSLTLGMMLYAVPQLRFEQPFGWPSLFAIVWIAFALMVIAAHLHELLGVDEEQRRELKKIKNMQKWQRSQRLGRLSKSMEYKKQV